MRLIPEGVPKRGRIDARHLLLLSSNLDISRVREHLAQISDRGYAR